MTSHLISDLRTLLYNHPNAARVLVLAAIFASGWFDAAILKSKNAACATWFLGLGALTAWTALPWTTVRICLGTVVFVSGIILMIVYYIRAETGSQAHS
jgi:hypothetical protein